ncbi:MAG: DUF2764 family protein [Candidatus Aminicenantes bacterium]|nr:DUF2764 family protein [Candidatus Aminicenantes bacterium]
MSDRYYYLVAQLPGLRFGREPGISLPAFLAETGKWLGRKAMETVRQAALFDLSDEPGPSSLLNRIKSFERDFRTELAAWRQARLDGRDLRTSFPPGLVREGDPLEVERRLLRFRWDRLEEEAQGHHFDLEAVLIYHLKLQILVRLAVFDAIRGLEAYRDLTGRASLQT